MDYASSFFELQLRFARKVEALTGLPSDRVLLDYTNPYIRFGLGLFQVLVLEAPVREFLDFYAI